MKQHERIKRKEDPPGAGQPGLKDPKAIREAEEKAKQRKANRLYGDIAVLFVVVAVVLLLVNAGVFYRDPDAVTIGGENYSAAKVNYYETTIRACTTASPTPATTAWTPASPWISRT